VRLDGQQFQMSVLSGILWFKVTERYPLSGQPVQWRRRDLRRGGCAPPGVEGVLGGLLSMLCSAGAACHGCPWLRRMSRVAGRRSELNTQGELPAS
jgi:hypothetical protein